MCANWSKARDYVNILDVLLNGVLAASHGSLSSEQARSLDAKRQCFYSIDTT